MTSVVEKIGLVLTGGGKRCAYSAGALRALTDVYGFTQPYALGAESGSAGNAFYYLAGQYDELHTVWTKYLHDEQFVSRRGRINIDYLIDEICKKKVPLNTKKLSAAKTKFYITVTNAETGATEFVSNSSFFDYYETLRAAKALPVVYGKKVRLGLKRYIDGGMSANIQTLATKILDTGVSTLITINCEPVRRDTLSQVFLTAAALRSPRGLRLAMLRDLAIPPGLCPTGVSARAYCLSPSKPLSVGTITGTPEAITEAFNLGYADVAGSAELRALFATTHGKSTRRK
jgi:predicted patatin/cPLA2 family phospholipase